MNSTESGFGEEKTYGRKDQGLSLGGSHDEQGKVRYENVVLSWQTESRITHSGKMVKCTLQSLRERADKVRAMREAGDLPPLVVGNGRKPPPNSRRAGTQTNWNRDYYQIAHKASQTE